MLLCIYVCVFEFGKKARVAVRKIPNEVVVSEPLRPRAFSFASFPASASIKKLREYKKYSANFISSRIERHKMYKNTYARCKYWLALCVRKWVSGKGPKGAA